MNVENIEILVEECLRRLSAGAGLEEVLVDFPDQAEELRPMLQAALDLQQLAADIKTPQSAQMRSRAQFLTTAARTNSSSQKRGFRFGIFHLRLAASSAILIGIIAAVLLLGSGFASAASLPGDIFYPVKIMVEQIQINLVKDPPARLEMEEVYDDRRQEEVARLTKMQRREQVTFSGFLQNVGDGKWKVGTLQIVFPAGSPDPVNYEDAYVEIVGESDSDMVEVQSIDLHRLQWEGILQKVDDQSWLISGLSVMLTDDTEISGSTPSIGATVLVIAVRPSGSQFTALSLAVTSLPPTTIRVLSNPSPTPSQEAGESREPVESKQSTPEPKEISPTPQPESQPTQTRKTEEEENKTKSPPTPTQESSEKPRATRTPTREPESTRSQTSVPEPTRTPDHSD